MKVIIDPYRGGIDTGDAIEGKLEKDIILDLSKYFSNRLKDNNIESVLTRNDDDNLTDMERVDIINNLSDDNDLVIQNRINLKNGLNIIYPLSYTDKLESIISSNLSKKGFNVNKYYQRRLPTDTMYDYYSIIKDTRPNETIIIEYNDLDTINNQVDVIVDSILEYLSLSNTYKVIAGDTLYSIARKFNTTVDELKKLNNLTNNNLSIGQILKVKTESNIESEYIAYKVVPGDTLYGISRKYNVSVEDIKKLNNLSNNILTVGSLLKIPIVVTNYTTYKIVSGDTLYSIAKKYNTTVDDIKKLNGLESNLLTVGNIIKIPN